MLMPCGLIGSARLPGSFNWFHRTASRTAARFGGHFGDFSDVSELLSCVGDDATAQGHQGPGLAGAFHDNVATLPVNKGVMLLHFLVETRGQLIQKDLRLGRV